MLKPKFETYRYVGEVCRLKSQSMVECRLSGSEIGSILAVYANATPLESVCVDGGMQYKGRLTLLVTYEDSERKLCRVERGAEFYHKAEGEAVAPSCFAKTAFRCENVTWRREGSGLYISVVVGAENTVYGSRQTDYLSGGDGLIVKTETVKAYKSICVSGDTEDEDEFELDYVCDVLSHSENVIVNGAYASGGQIEVEGEICLHLCVLKGEDGVCSYERLIPFKSTIPCEDGYGNITAGAKARVFNSHVSAQVDEEKGNSKILFSFGVHTDCDFAVCDDLTIVSDLFSPLVETFPKKKKEGGRYLSNQIKCVERVSGTAILSPQNEGEYTLLASLLPRAEITCRKGERGMEAEGVILAEVLLGGADGSTRSSTLTLPFVFPIECDGEDFEADAVVCGLNVRRKKNGETEAEATLKVSVRSFETRSWEYVCDIVEGEEYGEEECAFSVFLTNAGEDLWQVAKRLRRAPEELQKSNPELVFPLKEGERICVYRQIKG